MAAAVARHFASDDLAVRVIAGEVLVEMGAPAVDAVGALLGADDVDQLKFAIDLLARMPAAPLAPRLAALLAHPDGNIRLAAVDALGDLGQTAYAPRLRALYAADAEARPHIIEVIGKLGRPEDADLLEEALVDEDPVVQLCASEALAAYGGPGVLQALVGRLERLPAAARSVVLSAIVTCCEARPEQAAALPGALAESFVGMLADPDPEYRRTAMRGLRRFPGAAAVRALLPYAGADDTADEVAYELLCDLPDPLALLETGVAAAELTPGAAGAFALALLAREQIAPEAYARAAALLGAVFPELDADAKMMTLDVCSRLGLPELEAVAAAGQDDPDPTVRQFAADLAALIA